MNWLLSWIGYTVFFFLLLGAVFGLLVGMVFMIQLNPIVGGIIVLVVASAILSWLAIS